MKLIAVQLPVSRCGDPLLFFLRTRGHTFPLPARRHGHCFPYATTHDVLKHDTEASVRRPVFSVVFRGYCAVACFNVTTVLCVRYDLLGCWDFRRRRTMNYGAVVIDLDWRKREKEFYA